MPSACKEGKRGIMNKGKAYEEKKSFERSREDIKHGRVTRWSSADEMCQTLGI